MIIIQKITTSDHESYDFVEKLMCTTFPIEEYRDLKEQRHLADVNPHFSVNLILNVQSPIGFINNWQFNEFLFIEHFALSPNLTNQGFGTQAIDRLLQSTHQPIILEVEPPNSEINERRIRFYQQKGFSLWNHSYEQPPYRKGYAFLPMRLMSLGSLNEISDYEWIRTKIYSDVYGISINSPR